MSSLRIVRLMLAAAICAGLIGSAAYWLLRTPCVTDEGATIGDVKRTPDGTLLYFDGRCWTPKPPAPQDAPL